MKIICSKIDLMNGINMVAKAVSSKTTIPLLEGILIEAGENLKLTANDLAIGIECYVPADIRIPGSTVINARLFADMVRRFPEAEVSIELRDDRILVIECEKSHFELKSLSPSGFPALNQVKKDNAFRIPSNELKEMIRQTIFAVSIDENRPILTGAYMEYIEGTLAIVACDSFRVALRKYTSENTNPQMCIVVPGKTLNEISKILPSGDDIVTIYYAKNQIMFDMGPCKLVSRLIEGEYFKYRSFIHEDYETKLTVDKKELLNSIERASLIILSEERKYPVRFNISDEKMIIMTNTDMGIVKEEVRVIKEGGDMEINFNPRYFIDALRVVEDEKIELLFTSGVGPCMIRSLHGDVYTHLIVPLRK